LWRLFVLHRIMMLCFVNRILKFVLPRVRQTWRLTRHANNNYSKVWLSKNVKLIWLWVVTNKEPSQ
jgi:hypothetical protein